MIDFEDEGGGSTRRLTEGKTLRSALLMLGMCTTFTLAASLFLKHIVPPSSPAATAGGRVAAAIDPNKLATGRSLNMSVYRADGSGHFFIDGVVNGAHVRFLVDTGATVVALTQEDARAAGITRAGLSYSETLTTANGDAKAAPVNLRELRLDQLAIDDVPAVVMEQPMPISLLGMSFLKRLSGYSIRDGVLTIEW